jgi:hypothetical protein
MLQNFKPISVFQIGKTIIVGLLVVYAAGISFALVKMMPQNIIIGIDPYGTRIIETSDDRLIRLERHNFIKLFIRRLYTFESESLSKSLSDAGDMMSLELWNKKESDYQKLLEELKSSPFQQISKIEDLREIDPNTYQADLELIIKKNLEEKRMRIRLSVVIVTANRSLKNPYPYQVETYDEQSL